MKRILALLAVLTLFLGSSFAQIQQSGAVATPSATQSILGGVNVAMTNATCNVLTPGSACTLAGTSQSYLVSYYLTYNITSATSAQSLVIPLQPGAEHWVNNTSAFVITAGGSTGTTVAVQPGTDVLIHCPDGGNYVQSAVIGTGTSGTIPLWSGTSSLGNSPLSVANSPTTGGVFDAGTFYGKDVCWHYESGGTPTAACLQYAGHGTYYGPYNTDDGTTFTPTPFSVGQLQIGQPGATGANGQDEAPNILFYQGGTDTSAPGIAKIAMYQAQPTGACPDAGTPLALPVWGFAADDTISHCTNATSSSWSLFSNGGGSALLLGPVGSQSVVQPAGTSAAINTLGGSGSLGGVDFASQFASMADAVADAAAYNRGVSNDLCVFGGYANSQNVNIDYPCDRGHAHAGLVFPEQNGAYGDMELMLCTTTASSTSITCSGVSFVSADVGKYIEVDGALTGTVTSLVTTISSVTNSTTVVVASAPTASVSGLGSLYGHDDSSAIQVTMDYAATHHLAVELHPVNKYLVLNTLHLPSNLIMRGGGSQEGTWIQSEVNGDAFDLEPGPDVALHLSDFNVWCDAGLIGVSGGTGSQGLHFKGAYGRGFSAGGLWNTEIDNIEVDQCAGRGIFSDAGGNSADGTLPNQFLLFNNVVVNGPLQPHPLPLVDLIGETIQVKFTGGSTQPANITDFTQYPNGLWNIHNATTGVNDGPTNVTLDNYTIQEGSVCFNVTQSFNITFTHGYFEECNTAGTASFTSNLNIEKNNVQNSGSSTAAFIFSGGVSGRLEDSFGEVSSGSLPTLASCSNFNFLHISGNFPTSASNVVTTGCDTAITSVPSSGCLVIQTMDTLVNTSSTPITCINSFHNAGERASLFASGGPITLQSSGSLSMGAFASPMTVPSNTLVTLKNLDYPGNFWVVESANGVQQPQTGIFQTAGGSFPAQWQQIYSTNSGLTNGIPAGDNCFISYISNGSGSNVNEIAYCQEDGVFGVGEAGIIYSSHNTAAASPSFSVGPFGVGSFSLGGSALLTTVQGTDTAIMSAGTVTASQPVLCTDANGGATTVGCGSGSYSLGGTLSSGNFVLGVGAGVGASIDQVEGADGNHYIQITTGTSPLASSILFTTTFTASRGHNTFCLIQNSSAQIGHNNILVNVAGVSGGGTPSSTGYVAFTTLTAPDASTLYQFSVSCP